MINKLFVFKNKTVLVTGASKGIGFEISKYFGDLGAQVIMVSRNIADLKEAASEINSNIITFSTDLSSLNGINELADFITENFNSVDVLINNVGTNIRNETENANEEEFEFLINTNLRSGYHLSRKILPLLKKSEQGNVIFISSVAGLTHLRTGAIYAMTKSAINQLVKNLAVEWAKYNIRVNSVAPWYIETPLAKQVLTDEKYKAEVLSRTPMNRIGKPQEVATVVAFLASAGAGYITGQTIPVDGGFSIYGF
ncbi:MAG: glucose 1-dehydrogenase [Bacteroidales bacterium]|nr:glucose 1-dehydrogenase [Bacteroidales bacterium]MBN2758480.1 glucose 1-dehydrogenase [Bacteroidales bacterium]